MIHPSIDACVQLREQRRRAPRRSSASSCGCTRWCSSSPARRSRADGLEGKFSVYHGCAAGLIFGRAGEDEFADAVVTRADVVALRRKVVATVDDAIDEAAADVTAVLRDGRRVHVFVEHAIGSLERPMTDAELEAQVPRAGRPGARRSRAAPS